ncbi:hypothetical protein MMC30_008706 [Trapelia coarctata]|nr:hypothetical protein [Trapelia coarctata]
MEPLAMETETVLSPIQKLKQKLAEEAKDWATPLRDNVSVFDRWTGGPAPVTSPIPSRKWTQRILHQGHWDEHSDDWPLSGAQALPMPVTIASPDSLEPFFRHLGTIRGNRTEWADVLDADFRSAAFEISKEPYYGVEMCEWEKGVLYKDGRMDLCKMVVGPPNISNLMRSLESNNFVRHFLLGNNIIGPAGARAIANFVDRYPNRMETWYLAGNCIDTRSFCTLARSWENSNAITNLWLKRNPLGPQSVPALCDLIRVSSVLRTLDLDQTELSDAGITQLFTQLLKITTDNPLLPLRTLYLNSTGISGAACTAIANYLASPCCALESLYISNNPVGTTGLLALSVGLNQNNSLVRLCLSSCGLSNKGATALFRALTGHRKLSYLDIGQSFATSDLGSRYNYFGDGQRLEDGVVKFLELTPRLRGLSLGTTALSLKTLEKFAGMVLQSNLVYYEARSTLPASAVDNKQQQHTNFAIRSRLMYNVRCTYPGFKDRNYSDFEQSELRWLRNTKDVRFIDSVYRNRDIAAARRQEMVLRKLWTEEDGDLEEMIGS